MRRFVSFDEEFRRVEGLRVTTRRRTAADLARTAPLPEAQRILDRWLVLHRINFDELVEDIGRQRGPGASQARLLTRSAQDRAASAAERLAHHHFDEAGLKGWEANYRVPLQGGFAIVDIAFPGLRIAVEINGWAYHRTPDQRSHDDARAADLQMAGWLVMTFTWWDLQTRPRWVIARVRQAIARRQSVG